MRSAGKRTLHSKSANHYASRCGSDDGSLIKRCLHVRFPPKTDITVVSINRSGKVGAGREQGLRVALLGTARLVLPTGPLFSSRAADIDPLQTFRSLCMLRIE